MNDNLIFRRISKQFAIGERKLVHLIGNQVKFMPQYCLNFEKHMTEVLHQMKNRKRTAVWIFLVFLMLEP
jgi:hypothetical protein